MNKPHLRFKPSHIQNPPGPLHHRKSTKKNAQIHSPTKLFNGTPTSSKGFGSFPSGLRLHLAPILFPAYPCAVLGKGEDSVPRSGKACVADEEMKADMRTEGEEEGLVDESCS